MLPKAQLLKVDGMHKAISQGNIGFSKAQSDRLDDRMQPKRSEQFDSYNMMSARPINNK